MWPFENCKRHKSYNVLPKRFQFSFYGLTITNQMDTLHWIVANFATIIFKKILIYLFFLIIHIQQFRGIRNKFLVLMLLARKKMAIKNGYEKYVIYLILVAEKKLAVKTIR